jgi:hypothetical protein
MLKTKVVSLECQLGYIGTLGRLLNLDEEVTFADELWHVQAA